MHSRRRIDTNGILVGAIAALLCVGSTGHGEAGTPLASPFRDLHPGQHLASSTGPSIERQMRLRGGSHPSFESRSFPFPKKGFGTDHFFGEVDIGSDEDDTSTPSSSRVHQFPKMGSLPPDPHGRLRVPVDACLCGAVGSRCGQESAPRILLMRGYHNRVYNVKAGSRMEIEGEESDVEVHGENAAERIHEANKKRKIELIDTQTRHTMVCCQWHLAHNSSGGMRSLHLVNPLSDNSSSPPCINITGGGWTFSRVRAASCHSAAVSCEESCVLGCDWCVFEGLDSETLRASVALQVGGKASVKASRTVAQDTFGPSVLAEGDGRVELWDCTLQYGLYGCSMGGSSDVGLFKCWVRRQRNAALACVPGLEGGSGRNLNMSECFGGMTRQVWATSRRPSSVSEEGCVWGGVEERGAESAVLEEEALEWMGKMRMLEGQDEKVSKEMDADKWRKGGAIREKVRKFNAAVLNRHESWLKRRRWMKSFVFNVENGWENATGREVDSDDLIYDNEVGMQARPTPGLEPIVMTLLRDTGEEDYPVEEVIVRNRSSLSLDMCTLGPSDIPDTDSRAVSLVKTHGENAIMPRLSVLGKRLAGQMPFEFEQRNRTGLNHYTRLDDSEVAKRSFWTEPSNNSHLVTEIGPGPSDNLDDERQRVIEAGGVPLSLEDVRRMRPRPKGTVPKVEGISGSEEEYDDDLSDDDLSGSTEAGSNSNSQSIKLDSTSEGGGVDVSEEGPRWRRADESGWGDDDDVNQDGPQYDIP